MNPSALRKSLLPLAWLILLLAGCSDDDPASPATPLWLEVDLGAPASTQMVAVDFNGDHGLAMGLAFGKSGGKDWGITHEFFRMQADGGWLPVNLASIPASIVFLDLSLDSAGNPVLAGIQDTGNPGVVLDFRTAKPGYITYFSRGLLTVDGEGSFMVAGGRARGGDLWSSTEPGVWKVDGLPLTGTNDSGFRDVCIRGDRAVACGFDDGADTLQVILTRTATSQWEKIQPAGPSTRTFYCIALGDDGTIFVGGIEGAGGMSPKAFLTQRSPDGLWADLILPDPELLHGVNDILIADDGSIYLACMGEGDQSQANLVHGNPAGVRKEITSFPGGLLQLDQAANGDIFAVGFRRDDQDGTEKGVMLVRSP